MPEIYRLPGVFEPFSAISHFFGASAFLILGIGVIRRGWGDPSRVAFLSIYAGTGVLLFLASAGFHMATPGGNLRWVMERLDHAAIFLLIAGTFTPIHGILFHGWLRWIPLLLMWMTALAALTLKTIFFDDVARSLSLACYLILGWFGLVSASLLARRYGYAFVRLPLLGGVAYSVGAIANFLDWPTPVPGIVHAHEVFHVAVLGGAFCHWCFIWQFADGQVRVVRRLPVPNEAQTKSSLPVSAWGR